MGARTTVCICGTFEHNGCWYGFTIHSWGNIPFKDKSGRHIAPHQHSDARDVPVMSTRCGALRWLFIDEVEATGADTIGDLEQNVRFHVSSKNRYKKHKKQDSTVGSPGKKLRTRNQSRQWPVVFLTLSADRVFLGHHVRINQATGATIESHTRHRKLKQCQLTDGQEPWTRLSHK